MASTLNTLDKIVIPAEVLDLEGATSSIEKTIDISTYLPNGVSLVISSDAKVDVTAEIEKIETREYRVPVANITSTGLKAGYQLSYTERYLTIYVSAGKTALGHLNVADIRGTINVENLGEGLHLAAVSIDLDETVYRVGDVLAEIKLTSTVTEPGNSSETESETDTDTEAPDTEKPDDGSVESGSSGGNTPEDSTETGSEGTETTEVQNEGN